MEFDFNEDMRAKVCGALAVIKQYEWLLNSYVVDFFAEDHWSKLPQTWQKAFLHMELADFGNYLTNGEINVVLPLSFIAMMAAIKRYSICRQPQKIYQENIKQQKSSSNLKLEHNVSNSNHEAKVDSKCVLNMNLDQNIPSSNQEITEQIKCVPNSNCAVNVKSTSVPNMNLQHIDSDSNKKIMEALNGVPNLKCSENVKSRCIPNLNSQEIDPDSNQIKIEEMKTILNSNMESKCVLKMNLQQTIPDSNQIVKRGIENALNSNQIIEDAAKSITNSNSLECSNVYKYSNTGKSVPNSNESEHCGDHPRLANLFLKHVKSKKRHEISLMATLVGLVAAKVDCSSIVDIGSGLGHLLRNLAYKHSLKVLGIEGQKKLTDGARDLDHKFEYMALKYSIDKEKLLYLKPQHLNLMVTPDLDTKTLLRTIQNAVGSTFGLVGLHPCGDLGPQLIKLFREIPQVKFICIAGCCFMKITCGESKDRGYPLSNFVSQLEFNCLSYESREIACHAIETYCERLKNGDYEDLRVHSFRAILEKILVTKWPHMKHIGLRSIKHHNTLTFQRYCEIATERIDIKLSPEELTSDWVMEDLKRWRQVVMFYTLRLILAPLVESVILMDRVISLQEYGAACGVLPLFDPLISPRNQILIAKKS